MQTPYYLLEEDKLRRNLSLIRDVADRSGAEIILAFKAFALWKTFHIFREYIHATTASSPDEARLALEEFGTPAHTYSPAYTERDFPEILRCSSHITFNSLSQYRRFRTCGESVSFGLRVNPEYSEIETELYNPCAPGSRFGVLAEDLPRPEDFPADIEGFHIHCHCESGADVFARTLVHIINKFSPWFSRLKWINFGGGHLMTRRDYDVELLVQTLRDFHIRFPHLRMILEPGSAFAWQTGPLVASIVDIVENHGIKTAILDVSFTCHMPDCLEMPYHPTIKTRISSQSSEEVDYITAQLLDSDLSEHSSCLFCKTLDKAPYPYRLGGNSCLAGDFMGTWLFPHPLHVGDEIIFEDMIHYTTVKTTTFNGVHHPSIAFKRLDGTIELLREFRYKDYRDRMD
ncbi:MAG: carboxynorspermidine decarboxylase [Bacteroidaceae bacterium]|nr:carboxynorspermidine decarboxylase [Bacteroidaceae bacterium]